MKMKIKLNTKLWWKLYNLFILKLSQATSIVVKAGFTWFFISFTTSQKILLKSRIYPENITKPNVSTVWNVSKYGIFFNHAVILILSGRIWGLQNFICGIVKLFEKNEPKVFRFIGHRNELVKKQLNLMNGTCLKSLKEWPKQHRWKIFNYYSGLYSLQESTKKKIFRSIFEK